MTAQRARSTAWLLFGLTVAAVWTVGVAFTGAFLFAAVGALIVSRHPRHTIGWIFTGQFSDAAIIITVALIATLFTPVRNGLQKIVDLRFKDARDLERLMETLENEVGHVVDVIVARRLADRLLRTAREGADATGAALFLDGTTDGRPTFTAGEWGGKAELVVPLRAGATKIGRLELASRRHGAPYANRFLVFWTTLSTVPDREAPGSNPGPPTSSEFCEDPGRWLLPRG